MLKRDEWSEVSTTALSPCPGKGQCSSPSEYSTLGDVMATPSGRIREVTVTVSIVLL